MGGTVATTAASSQFRDKKQQQKIANLGGKHKDEIIRIMMPVYYNDETITESEYQLAQENWNSILLDKTKVYQKKRNDLSFEFDSAITYFYSLFYNRLFDIHPVSKDLFKNAEGQGKFLDKMIALAFSEKANPERFEQSLIHLAQIHNERGVKAVEYGIVGEVLFWAIRASIGRENFTQHMHAAWVKIYCRMLYVMVPLAVAHELSDGTNQGKRYWGHSVGMTKDEEEKALATTIQQSCSQSLISFGASSHGEGCPVRGMYV